MFYLFMSRILKTPSNILNMKELNDAFHMKPLYSINYLNPFSNCNLLQTEISITLDVPW